MALSADQLTDRMAECGVSSMGSGEMAHLASARISAIPNGSPDNGALLDACHVHAKALAPDQPETAFQLAQNLPEGPALS